MSLNQIITKTTRTSTTAIHRLI